MNVCHKCNHPLLDHSTLTGMCYNNNGCKCQHFEEEPDYDQDGYTW